MLISKPLKTEDFLLSITQKIKYSLTNLEKKQKVRKKEFFEKFRKKLFLKKFQKKSFEKFVRLLKPSKVVSARKTQKKFFRLDRPSFFRLTDQPLVHQILD